jgi:pSer/pThr/pTyr-binding forkhead associated (FHA) protein
VHCSHCGGALADDVNFCPTCGTPVGDAAESEDTTASIDVGDLDPEHDLDGTPTLPPGTGMLVVVRGPNAGSRYLLDREITTVGRHPDSAIFLDDVTVSRRHAELTRDGVTIVLRDLGSLNGSYVNGERVDQRQLGTGDEVQIGRFKLLFVGTAGGASS